MNKIEFFKNKKIKIIKNIYIFFLWSKQCNDMKTFFFGGGGGIFYILLSLQAIRNTSSFVFSSCAPFSGLLSLGHECAHYSTVLDSFP